MLAASRPRTPLRVFCIATFEYLARLKGGTLGKQRRVAMALACDFGSLRDEFYDERKLDRREYRSLRNGLRETAPKEATVRYMRELRNAERARPVLSDKTQRIAKALIGYRELVIQLSLRWMQEIAGVDLESVKFRSLVSLVCLMQLADDLLDWKEDEACGCPSYVTAFLHDQPDAVIAAPLRAQADTLLRRVIRRARVDAGCVPFALAVLVTWVLVVALIKVRFPR